MTYISPRHQIIPLGLVCYIPGQEHPILRPLPIEPWPIEFKIEIFEARIDGWHLEIADRCINGWKLDGRDCINGQHFNQILNQEPAHYIVDSGWAVLQMVLNYFETVGWFKYGCENQSYKNFENGFFDVFPELKGHRPNLFKLIWGQLRNGLYHAGVGSDRIFLWSSNESLALDYDTKTERLRVDPHKFVPKLRHHLRNYVEQLRDPNEVELRETFLRGWERKYESK